MNFNNMEIKSMCKKELIIAYGVSYKTFCKWLKSVPDLGNVKHVHIFSPKQVSLIFSHLGQP